MKTAGWSATTVDPQSRATLFGREQLSEEDPIGVTRRPVEADAVDPPITCTSLISVTGNKAAGPDTGEVEALSLSTGKVEWDTKVLRCRHAATVSNDLVFTTLYRGVLIASTAIPAPSFTSTSYPHRRNSPIAVSGNTVLVPAGGPETSASGGGGNPQLVATRFRNHHGSELPPLRQWKGTREARTEKSVRQADR